MHVAEKVEWQDIVQFEAIEAAAIVISMRHDRAGEDLQQQHRRNYNEIFADTALAVGERQEGDQHRIHRRLVGVAQIALVDEQHGAECEEGEAEASPGPDEGVGGRGVADLRLIGPILGPGPGGIGTACDRGQCRVDQEFGGMRRLALIEAIGRGPACDEIDGAQVLRHLGPQRDDRARQCFGNGDLALRQVDRLQLPPHLVADCGFPIFGQPVETRCEALLGELLLGQFRKPHQRKGGVVLPEIGAHPVKAPVIHQVCFLETGLSGDDILGGHQGGTTGRDEPVGLGGGPVVGQHRRPCKERKASDRDGEQYPFQDVADPVSQRRS